MNICNFSSARNQEIRSDFLWKYETNEGELLEMAIAIPLSEEESRVRKEEEKELATGQDLSIVPRGKVKGFKS